MIAKKEETIHSESIDLRPEMGIFIPSVLVVVLISVVTFLWPDASTSLLAKIYQPFVKAFGTASIWFSALAVLAAIYFSFSKYGDIKFGKADEKPQYSFFSWASMIFCSGIAGAAMFWSICEPLFHVVSPPKNMLPLSLEAFNWSISFLLLHWGPTTYITFFMTALPIAYMFHIKNSPFLRISTAAEIIIGKQSNRLLGRSVDVFFILGLLFCTAVTMCISVPTVDAAFSKILNISPSFTGQVITMMVSAGIAIFSVYLGLDNGMKKLSNFTIIFSFVVIFYVAVMGPTSTLLNIFTNAFGNLVSNYFSMLFDTHPFTDSNFSSSWTVFYIFFNIGYGAFMGLFIARISRGRTVRDILLWGTVGMVSGGYLLHSVLSSYTLYLQHTGILDLATVISEQGGVAAMVEVLNSLPFGKVVLFAYCIFSTFFLATSVDATCYVISSTATKRMNFDSNPHRAHRVFWGLIQAFLALGFIVLNSLDTAKILGNFAGAFMSLPVILLMICWFKIIKVDGANLLKNNVYRP